MKEVKISNKELNELYGAILDLKNTEECRRFFRDLCTLSELSSMSERFQVAKLVKQGIAYRNISKQTGSSTATITRVAHWVHHGKGGYQLLLNRNYS